MINFIMVLFKLASKAFSQFYSQNSKAFYISSFYFNLSRSIFVVCICMCVYYAALVVVCKTTINHLSNSNILDDKRQPKAALKICLQFFFLFFLSSSLSLSPPYSLLVSTFPSIYLAFIFYRLVIDHDAEYSFCIQNSTIENIDIHKKWRWKKKPEEKLR